MDGRSKDYWIGRCIGVAMCLNWREDIPKDVKNALDQMRKDFEEWEKEREVNE